MGQATCLIFAAKGDKVCCSFNEEMGRETVDQITANGGGHYVKTDVSKQEDVESLINKAVKHTEGSISFNNAGIGAAV
jgi:NAD(P)-dependent dehydrogenase (short-subunit alcohol dehydrogenase family)